MAKEEKKVIQFEDFQVEVNVRYKEDELKMFRKGKEIIDSCTTIVQLDSADKIVDLIGKSYIGVKNALLYFLEDKREQMREERENIDKLFAEGSAIADPELD